MVLQTKSKKDISNFKLRVNVPIGVRVTLRDNTMYEFLDRLIAKLADPACRACLDQLQSHRGS